MVQRADKCSPHFPHSGERSVESVRAGEADALDPFTVLQEKEEKVPILVRNIKSIFQSHCFLVLFKVFTFEVTFE